MTLKQSIKRILKEDKDYTKLLKSIIDSSDVFNYKYYCGYDIIHPNERTDQYYFLSKDKIPFLIKVYFVGGPNSEVWPRTQAIQNKELDLMGDLREYITSLVPFNIEMMGSHVNSCNGYEKLMKRKYTTDDLQENIRRILREEFNNKYLYHGTSYDNAINMIENGFNEETYWGGMETAKQYAYSYDQPTLIKVKKNEIVDLLEPNYTLIDYYKDNLEYDEDYQEIIDEWEKSDKNVEDSLRIFDSVILFPSYLSISKKNIIRL